MLDFASSTKTCEVECFFAACFNWNDNKIQNLWIWWKKGRGGETIYLYTHTPNNSYIFWIYKISMPVYSKIRL